MAMTTKYVSTAGGGSHDGSSWANAFTFAEMVSDINAGGKAGTIYSVLKGTYGLSADVTITGDGSTSSPIIIQGCNATPGDLRNAKRNAAGALDSSNMPVFSWSPGRLDASGGDKIVFESVRFTGSPSYYLIQAGDNCKFVNCVVENTSTNSAASTIGTSGNHIQMVNCDLSGGGTSASYAVNVGHAYAVLRNCRITGNGYGLACTSSSSCVAVENLILNCPTGGIYVGSGAWCYPDKNTIYACGDGIVYQSGSSLAAVAGENHITDCTGYAVRYNGNTIPKTRFGLRTRDNASGVDDATGDWDDNCDFFPVTTDAGGASTDFTASGSGDFTLVATAAAVGAGINPYCDIGAFGAARTSGGGMKGYAAA